MMISGTLKVKKAVVLLFIFYKGSLHEKKLEIVWSFAKPGVGGTPNQTPWKKKEIVPNFAKGGGGGGLPPFDKKPNYFRFFS